MSFNKIKTFEMFIFHFLSIIHIFAFHILLIINQRSCLKLLKTKKKLYNNIIYLRLTEIDQSRKEMFLKTNEIASYNWNLGIEPSKVFYLMRK